jgi:hypothetical protein
MHCGKDIVRISPHHVINDGWLHEGGLYSCDQHNLYKKMAMPMVDGILYVEDTEELTETSS